MRALLCCDEDHIIIILLTLAYNYTQTINNSAIEETRRENNELLYSRMCNSVYTPLKGEHRQHFASLLLYVSSFKITSDPGLPWHNPISQCHHVYNVIMELETLQKPYLCSTCMWKIFHRCMG